MMKKFIVTNIAGFLAVAGVFTAMPVSAQTTASADVQSAVVQLRAARTRLNADKNDVTVRREHLDGIVSVLRSRINAQKRLRAANKEVTRILQDEDSRLAKFAARIRNANDAQLRTIAKEIRDGRANDTVRMGIINSYVSQVTAGVSAAEKRSARIADVLSGLTADTSTLQAELATADRLIAEAKGMVSDVTATVRAGGELNLAEIKTSLKGAAHNIFEAYRMFSEILTAAQAL